VKSYGLAIVCHVRGQTETLSLVAAAIALSWVETGNFNLIGLDVELRLDSLAQVNSLVGLQPYHGSCLPLITDQRMVASSGKVRRQ
jgi:hypothetical protein